MVHLVVGAVGGGKSSALLSIFDALGCGDGVVNRRVLRNGSWAGQEIVRLATGERRPYSFRDGFAPPGWDGQWRLGGLTISRSGLAFAQGAVQEAIEMGGEPVFLDEIGPLELEGAGFHRLFLESIRSGRACFAAVREGCLAAVLQRYGLQGARILPVCGEGK